MEALVKGSKELLEKVDRVNELNVYYMVFRVGSLRQTYSFDRHFVICLVLLKHQLLSCLPLEAHPWLARIKRRTRPSRQK